MARAPRKESLTGIYHVVSCGNGECLIFEGRQEKQQYLHYMEQVKEKKEIELFAYCVMEDHVHMVLRAELDEMSGYMRDLTSRYSAYFNGRHERRGHVFRERYKSECLEKAGDFWDCIRYVHRQPLLAGLTKDFYQYPYSSIQEYLHRHGRLLYADVRRMMNSRFGSRQGFLDFHKEMDQRIFADTQEDLNRQKEYLIRAQVRKFLQSNQVLTGEFLVNSKLRSCFCKELHDKTGLSFRQIGEVLERVCMEVEFQERN
jgi:putative transposase